MEAIRIIESITKVVENEVNKIEAGSQTKAMYIPSDTYNGYIVVVNTIQQQNDNYYKVGGYIIKQTNTDDVKTGLFNIKSKNIKATLLTNNLESEKVEIDFDSLVTTGEPINKNIGYTLKTDFTALIQLLNNSIDKKTAENFEVMYKEEIKEEE